MKQIKVPNWWDSIRSITTFEIITTYCLTMIGMIILTCIKMIEIPVFLAFLSGFSGTVGSIITFYYLGKRRNEGENNVKETTPTGGIHN